MVVGCGEISLLDEGLNLLKRGERFVVFDYVDGVFHLNQIYYSFLVIKTLKFSIFFTINYVKHNTK